MNNFEKYSKNGGWVTTPNRLWSAPFLSWKEKAIYTYLSAQNANYNFSITNIAKMSTDGNTVVSNAIKGLEDKGLLSRVRYQDEKGYWRIKYVLYDFVDVFPVKSCERKSYGGKSYPGKPPVITKIKSNKDQLNKDQGNSVSKKISKSKWYEYTFDKFWELYPNKKAKGHAQKVWCANIPRDNNVVVEILNAVKNQKQSRQWQEEGGRYIPHPGTWLNQRRWLDEVSVVDNKKRVY